MRETLQRYNNEVKSTSTETEQMNFMKLTE